MSLPAAFPSTGRELWVAWLGYGNPYWDAVERAAAGTLIGSQSARIRVCWNATTGAPAEWHATLFTLAAETPDPERTVRATGEYKPAGVLLHHVITDEPHPEAAAPPDPRPADIAARVGEAFAARRALAALDGDPRSPATALVHARSEREVRVAPARVAVEQAINDGLRARAGFLLVPPMIVKREMMGDWIAYQLLLALRRALAPPDGDREASPSAGRAAPCSCRAAARPGSSAGSAAIGRRSRWSWASAR